MTEPVNLDQVRALRNVLGMFATGITVVTAVG
jgi:flavin reductase (DIM6/NTAB) family NADH-FMN oxidoreductase RutF